MTRTSSQRIPKRTLTTDMIQVNQSIIISFTSIRVLGYSTSMANGYLTLLQGHSTLTFSSLPPSFRFNLYHTSKRDLSTFGKLKNTPSQFSQFYSHTTWTGTNVPVQPNRLLYEYSTVPVLYSTSNVRLSTAVLPILALPMTTLLFSSSSLLSSSLSRKDSHSMVQCKIETQSSAIAR